MRAVVVTATGGPEVVQVRDMPDPPVPAGHVRIAVAAAGVNFGDLLARCGLHPGAPRPPFVLGFEIAGRIERVGRDVAELQEGDRVVAVTRLHGQAELVTVPATDVMRLPSRLSYDQGAALPVNYMTAYAALIEMGGVRAGHRVLIHSAAGGVGLAAVQLGRWVGAKPLGISAPAKHAALRANGVTHTIDRACDFAAQVMDLTDGQGVDVIIDATGPRNYRKDYRLLRPGGRLIMLGLSDVVAPRPRARVAVVPTILRLSLATMPWWNGLALLRQNKGAFGLDLLKWWDDEPIADRLLRCVVELAGDGAIAPVVDTRFTFEQAADAHAYLHERRNIGKVLLVP